MDVDKTILITEDQMTAKTVNASDHEFCTACGNEMQKSPQRPGFLVCASCGAIRQARKKLFQPGEIIGDYRLLHKLGEGGMGLLYMCCPVNDPGTRFALKILRRDVLSSSASECEKRFCREADMLMKLSHPSIVKTYTSWSDDSGYYCLMEYIDGMNLTEMKKEDYCFDEPTVINIMLLVADALNYAWENFKILHRDIKPSNIMIDSTGTLKLLDFGIAKSLEEENISTLTISGQGLGTPGYMSPEQFRNAGKLTCSADIYSLGATAYFLLTGHPPYNGESAGEVFRNMLSGTVRSVSEFGVSLSRPAEMLLRQMLEKEPSKRPFSWKKLLLSLQRVQNGKPPLL